MPTDWNIAIETSSPHGSVAIGRGAELVETVCAPQPRRHNLDLVPAIDAVFRRHGASPRELGAVYVSLGPGSFTGLRIAVATARMLALTTGARLLGVPTAEVIAHAAGTVTDHLAVCLNLKHDHYHATRFRKESEQWQIAEAPALMTLGEVLAATPRPLALIAAPPPDPPIEQEGHTVSWLPAEAGIPRAEALWHVGREREHRGESTEPAALLPIYARPPEAVALWEKRKAKRV